MDCAAVAERLTDLMEGDLDAADEASALEHLATCSACETVLAQTREVVALTKDHGRVELSEQDRTRLWTRVIGETGPS